MENIKQFLKMSEADAWVIYDFASTNPAFTKLFGKLFLTRKCFVIIRPDKYDTIVCHAIDSFAFTTHKNHDKFQLRVFKSWHELEAIMSEELCKNDLVLMEISENGLLPRTSYVDYGTVCFIQKYVKEVRSSADLFQFVTARLSKRSIEIHNATAQVINKIKDSAFEYIFNKVDEFGRVSEYEVQQFILKKFHENNLMADSVPIVAIGPNANNPHYEPTEDNHSIINRGDLVLIDLWARKKDNDDAVFADITWMGYVGEEPPKEMVAVFDIVKGAIDKALEFLEENLPLRSVAGYEVDDICRNFISQAGYGEFFIHRTGHSLSVGESDHGVGANIDNFETHDTRALFDGIAFSIEPGIYLPAFGLREEINVYIEGNKPVVSTPRQDAIITMKSEGLISERPMD